MENRMLKRVCLTVICLSILVTVFAVNPVASTDQRGSRIDKIRYKVTRSPAAQLIEMTTGPPTGSDVQDGLIRPTDIETLRDAGKTISSRGGFHFCFTGMNYRVYPLSDVNYRHAIAHLMPKDRIIGSLFRYIVVKVDTPVPPAQSLWYNPKVDPHPYSPTEAEAILGAAGYKKVGGVWKDKDGVTSLPNLRFFCPLEIVAPTSFTIGRMLVEEAMKIGLMNIVLTPMDFATYLDLVFNKRDFELFWVCYGLGRFPTHIYFMAHSVNDFPGGDNCYGVHYPALDSLLEVLYYSLEHLAKVDATQRAQELIMGGTTTEPLPTYVAPTDPRSQALPIIPVYSRNYYDVQQPQVRGAVNMFGSGIANGWTQFYIHWNTPNEYRPGTSERTIVWVEDEFPERLNQLSATTVYAWDFMNPTLDGLIATNPFTHKDEPWLATDWSYVAVPGGMDVTFNIKLTDSEGQPIKWQDGKAVSADDIKFAWDFLKNWAIPNYWGSMKFYDPANTVIVDPDTIRARMTTTGQWHVYALAGNAYLLPPQVWSQDPRDGKPWESTTEIVGFDPSALSYPQPGNVNPGPTALPTQLFGTGAFILQHSTTFIGTQGYGDLNANRNGYWRTLTELETLLTEMFHSAGDVDRSGRVDGADISAIGLAYLTKPGDKLWNPDADVTGPGGTPPDNKVNFWDFVTACRFYRETKTIPFP